MEKIQRSIISIYRIPCLNDLGFLSVGGSKVVYQQKHIRRWNEKISSMHYLQGVFCADLRFDQLLRSIFPQHTVLDDVIFQQLLDDILLSKQTMNSLNLVYMEKNCWTLLLVELLPWHCATQDQKPIKNNYHFFLCAIIDEIFLVPVHTFMEKSIWKYHNNISRTNVTQKQTEKFPSSLTGNWLSTKYLLCFNTNLTFP